jgi:hypothetical protein
MKTATQVSTPKRHGSGWKVRSSMHGGSYFVSLAPRRCTCPAWAYGHGDLCKHLKAVMATEQEVAMVK